MRGLLALLLLTGCSSGQTGSPSCAPGRSCVCDPINGAGTLLRVRVESQRDGQLRAVIDQVVPSAYGTNGLESGDHIGGSLDLAQPCAPEAALEAAEGSELFVLFNPGVDGGYPNCLAFHGCASAQCAKLVEPALSECWNECEEQTRASCDAARQAALLDGRYAWAIPWTDPLSFGGEHELPRSELSVLATTEQCYARFAPDPTPACHDTRTVTCAATPHHAGSARALVAAALFLALAVASRRRR
jgi:hypothetical protein